MKKVFLAMVMAVLGLVTAPAGAFQWLLEMEPGEKIGFYSSCYDDWKAVEATNFNLRKALVEDPVIENPYQVTFYFQWLFDMEVAEPPTQYQGESLQRYNERLADYFRAVLWSRSLVCPVIAECCDGGLCTITNNLETSVSFPWSCILPLLEE